MCIRQGRDKPKRSLDSLSRLNDRVPALVVHVSTAPTDPQAPPTRGRSRHDWNQTSETRAFPNTTIPTRSAVGDQYCLIQT